MSRSWKRTVTILVGLLVLSGVGGWVLARGGFLAPSQPPPVSVAAQPLLVPTDVAPPSPTPVPPPTATPAPPSRGIQPTAEPTLTFEELERQRGEILRRAEQAGGRVVPVAGPATMGKSVFIAGKTVQLPPDAWVEHMIVAGECPVNSPTPCPELPLIIIRRGQATIQVAIRSGTIQAEKLAPGAEGTFDFLKEVLKK